MKFSIALTKKSILILMLSSLFTACGEDGPEKPRKPLTSQAVYLNELDQDRIAFREKDDVCERVKNFFRAYSERYLLDAKTQIECEEVSEKPTFSDAEMKDIGSDQLNCEKERRCFKVLFKVEYKGGTDRYYPIFAVYSDGKSRGTILASRRNKHYLPYGNSKVFSGELLHDGLAPLLNTFKIWLSN